MWRSLAALFVFVEGVLAQESNVVDGIAVPVGWGLAKLENQVPNKGDHPLDAHAGGDFAEQMARLSAHGVSGKGAVTAFYPPMSNEVPRQFAVVADSSHKRAPQSSKGQALGVAPRTASSQGLLRGSIGQAAVRTESDPEIVQAVIVPSKDGWMPRSMLHHSSVDEWVDGSAVESKEVDELPSPQVMAKKEADRIAKAKAEVAAAEAGEEVAQDDPSLPPCDPSKCALGKKPVKKDANATNGTDAPADAPAEKVDGSNYTYNISDKHDSYLNPAGGVLVAPSTESTPVASATPLLPASVLDTVRDVGCLEQLQKDPTSDCEPHHFVGGPAYPTQKENDDDDDDDDDDGNEKVDKKDEGAKDEDKKDESGRRRAVKKADKKEKDKEEPQEEETAESADEEAARLKKEAEEAEEKATKAEERAKKLKEEKHKKEKKGEDSEESNSGSWLNPFSLRAKGARAVEEVPGGGAAQTAPAAAVSQEEVPAGPDPGLHPSLQGHGEIGEVFHTKKRHHGRPLSALREKAEGDVRSSSPPTRLWPELPRYPA